MSKLSREDALWHTMRSLKQLNIAIDIESMDLDFFWSLLQTLLPQALSEAGLLETYTLFHFTQFSYYEVLSAVYCSCKLFE